MTINYKILKQFSSKFMVSTRSKNKIKNLFYLSLLNLPLLFITVLNINVVTVETFQLM